MKKRMIFFLSGFLFFVFLNPSSGIDKETLRKMMNSPVRTGGLAQMQSAAIKNLSLVEEILFFSDFTEDNGTARNNGLSILRGCAIEGSYDKERYFTTLLRLFNQASNIVHPSEIARLKKMIIANLASFGLVFSGNSFSFNLSSFPSLAASLSKSGFIKNQGLLKNLTKNLATANELLNKKGPNAKSMAINKIQAAITELDSQLGNSVAEGGYQFLSGYFKHVISIIQTVNF